MTYKNSIVKREIFLAILHFFLCISWSITSLSGLLPLDTVSSYVISFHNILWDLWLIFERK